MEENNKNSNKDNKIKGNSGDFDTGVLNSIIFIIFAVVAMYLISKYLT